GPRRDSDRAIGRVERQSAGSQRIRRARAHPARPGGEQVECIQRGSRPRDGADEFTQEDPGAGAGPWAGAVEDKPARMAAPQTQKGRPHGRPIVCNPLDFLLHLCYGRLTFSAWRPLGPRLTSNSTSAPSSRVRYPDIWIALKCTNTSSPLARWINP